MFFALLKFNPKIKTQKPKKSFELKKRDSSVGKFNLKGNKLKGFSKRVVYVNTQNIKLKIQG